MRISDWSSDVCSSDLRPANQEPRIVLMPLDVELSTLSAGGVTEPRADWSEQANKLLLDALKTEEQAKNIHMIPYQEDAKDSAGYQDQIGRESVRERVCKYV